MPPAMQKSSKVLDVNSPALSILKILMGFSGNWALSLRICESILGKAKFLVDNKETLDHFEDASMRTRKNLNGPLGGSIGPHISPCILSKKAGILNIVLEGAGLVMSLPLEQAIQGS